MPAVWRNWAGDQRCRPASIQVVRSARDVARVIERASVSGRTVRAAGTGHSFTDVACTDGVMLRLEGDLARVHHVDPETGLARVGGGIGIGELNRALDEHGRALENLGDVDYQTLAGAMATGTHGTGIGFPNLPGQVEAIELVTGEGEVLELTDASDRHAFRAARVGLGALGIVTAYTLRTVAAYRIHRVDRHAPLDETLAALDSHVDGNDHFEFYVFPHTGTAMLRESRRTDEPADLTEPWKVWLEEELIENRAFGAVNRLGRRLPVLIPRLNRAVSRQVGTSTKVDRSFRVYASNRHVRFTEMEYAIPREHAPEATRRVLDLIPGRGLDVSFPIEVRFAPKDDALLSTAYGRDTCYIAVHQFRRMDWYPYFRGVEAIMNDYKGRPHWGKRHFQLAETLKGRYPKWREFGRQRDRFDPDGRFRNDYTDRVLGPIG